MTVKSSALHPAIAAFPVRNGCIEVGGIVLTRLAERVGQTPFFAYDRRLLDARIAHLRKHLPKEIALHYAIKANPMPAVVQHLRGLVDGFDVASANEMRVALDTTMPPTQVSFAGPGKTEAELAQALAADITIEAESTRELHVIASLSERIGHRPRVALRINPDFDIKGSGMRMGGGPAQFGIDAEQAPAALRELKQLGLNFVGFHIFAGSQNLRGDLLQEIQARTIELAIALSAHAPALP